MNPRIKPASSMSTLFELLPIGAYQTSLCGRQLRANAALVRLNGCDSEAELLGMVNDIAHQWYVDPGRRDLFKQLIERDGHLLDFVSEIFRFKTRERIWIRENAHRVRDVDGKLLYYEGTVEDITASRQAQLALQESETRWRLALDSTGDGVWDWYVQTGEAFYSARFKQMYGYDDDDITNRAGDFDSRTHPDDIAQRQKDRKAHFCGQTPTYSNEHRVRCKDGSWKWVLSRGMVISRDAEGRALRMIGTHTDITDRKLAQAQLQESEERWKLALDSTGDGVWDWYVQTGQKFYSRRFREMYGFDPDDLASQPTDFFELTDPADHADQRRLRNAHFNGETPTYSSEHRMRCKDGSWKWVHSRGMVITRDAAGRPLRMIGTHTDITARKNAEALVWQQANYDPLTGLPNRRMLRQRLISNINRSESMGQALAILFIDLDHFKEVNDTLGHGSGDMLLVQAAQRIQRCLSEADTVARMGGDEFTVVLCDVPNIGRVERVLKAMLDSLASAFQLGREQVFVSASIGVAMYPLDATVVEDLFKHADQALYVAKGAGRNRYSFFTPTLHEEALTRLRLANDLHWGLARQQFEVVYQPIITLASGHVHKAEALLRWHHPERGLISPAQFIGIAESSGLIIEIGEWVFHQAARQVGLWRAAHHPDFQVSVNKSPVQFHHDGKAHAPWILHLDTLGLPGISIAVEITEGLLLDASSGVAQQLQGLRAAGVAVSLDDFGTGYSSMTYLQKFAIDYIKIDQSFVRNLRLGSTDLTLCKAIIVMAHELGMKVVAEGVETIEQRDLLTLAGCDYGQGYLFARPMSVAAFDQFMATTSRVVQTAA